MKASDLIAKAFQKAFPVFLGVWIAVLFPPVAHAQDVQEYLQAFQKIASDPRVQANGERVDGLRQGEWEFSLNGVKLAEIPFKEDLFYGEATLFDEDEKPQLVCTFFYDNLNGPFEEYYDNGKKLVEGQYLLNLLEGLYSNYYPNGQLSEEGAFADSLREGLWISYFPTGAVKDSGEYMDGLRDGKWHFFYPNKAMRMQETYKLGKLASVDFLADPKGKTLDPGKMTGGNGERLLYDSTGTLVAKAPYKNGLIEGTVKGIGRNGKTASETPYVAGLRQGIRKEYYPEGKLRTLIAFKNGVEYGPFKQVFPNGKAEVEGFYANGNEDSTWREYTQTGEIESRYAFRNTKPFGRWESFYPGGKLASLVVCQDGRKEGLFREFFQNGKTKTRGKYMRGEKDSIWTSYHDNGKLASMSAYHVGRPVGISVLYGPDGRELEREDFTYSKTLSTYSQFLPDGTTSITGYNDLDGEPDSLWTYYRRDGQVFQTELYKEGKLWWVTEAKLSITQPLAESNLTGGVGTRAIYSVQGKLLEKGTYIGGYKNGIWQEFDAEGKLKGEGTYRDGLKEGTWKTYNPKGKIDSEQNFKNGNADGDPTLYDKKGKAQGK